MAALLIMQNTLLEKDLEPLHTAVSRMVLNMAYTQVAVALQRASSDRMPETILRADKSVTIRSNVNRITIR